MTAAVFLPPPLAGWCVQARTTRALENCFLLLPELSGFGLCFRSQYVGVRYVSEEDDMPSALTLSQKACHPQGAQQLS
ncbi:hypothetical protein MUK42_35799 [Musa troglodytarum]|uniref:Uncharacterized protein n=1 Tax=Musa troglodytarum TaxID=320322 RepID=A0A9E7E9F7_9LILI|nr:hypothetical protein MUK42_35799 [Musa troglodytarum]